MRWRSWGRNLAIPIAGLAADETGRTGAFIGASTRVPRTYVIAADGTIVLRFCGNRSPRHSLKARPQLPMAEAAARLKLCPLFAFFLKYPKSCTCRAEGLRRGYLRKQ